MTITCIVCKKETIPFDKSRSFHKFPKDNDLKTKWMKTIGKFTIKKTSRICSDHFDAKSYHDTDGYTTIRRLLSTAVPRIICKEVLLDVANNNFTETSEKIEPEYFQNTESQHNIKIEENEMSQSEHNTQTLVSVKTECMASDLEVANKITENSDETVPEYFQSAESRHNIKIEENDISKYEENTQTLVSVKTECIVSDDAEVDYTLSINSLDHTQYNDLNISHDEIRKQDHHQDHSGIKTTLFENNIDYAKIRKFRCRGKFKTYCFTREKFSSDEAWAEFQEFVTFMKNKTAAAVKQNSQKQKKLDSLKMAMKKLKTTNEFQQSNSS